MVSLEEFDEIWCVDFEFSTSPGARPEPICLVATEVESGRTLRLWKDELLTRKDSPYPISDRSLVVAYYASAEIGCHLALGWNVPLRVLDLYTEFRNLSNGLPTLCGRGLQGALTYFGLDGLAVREKDSMRQLALRGGPWTSQEKHALLAYCESDVMALLQLLTKMRPQLDLPRALLRGASMVAAAHVEFWGVPMDLETLSRLRENWESAQEALIHKIDGHYGVYDGRTFKRERFEQYLNHNNISWPRLESGALDLQDDTFKDMARIYPTLNPLRELRTSLAQMRLANLAVGVDGRNRCLLSAFQAKTGRNQPSNSQFIFGPAVWLRGLIRPEPGTGLAYIDWSQQEFGIAAALSGDQVMLKAYESGDPYLAFAKQASPVPSNATKATHGTIREQFKACVLAVQYGMGEESLAVQIAQPVAQARQLLQMHQETYPVFWKWSDSAVDYAMLYGQLHTVFGWTVHIGSGANPRSLRNFPMQANGAEMLRLACLLGVERGLRICAPVHDALLIEAPLSILDQEVIRAQEAMADASAAVLDGFRLRSEAKVIRYPDRYMDDRGGHMWQTVMEVIGGGINIEATRC